MTSKEKLNYLDKLQNCLDGWHAWFNEHQGEAIDAELYELIKEDIEGLITLKYQLISDLSVKDIMTNDDIRRTGASICL